jgi:hypothetical protein
VYRAALVQQSVQSRASSTELTDRRRELTRARNLRSDPSPSAGGSLATSLGLLTPPPRRHRLNVLPGATASFLSPALGDGRDFHRSLRSPVCKQGVAVVTICTSVCQAAGVHHRTFIKVKTTKYTAYSTRHVHKVSFPLVPQLANLILREATTHT